MKPLIVLVSSFILILICMNLFNWWGRSYAFAGVLSMAIMLIFTAIGHFRYAEGMTLMLPSFVPNPKLLVYIAGILEILAAIGLLMPSPWKERAAWFLIIFFILLSPANIYAAYRHIDYEKADFDGPGLSYLWFRIPLQVFFICWVYFFSLTPHAAWI